MITKEQEKVIIEKSRPYSPNKIGIFGSYARGDNSHESDLDVLVDFNKKVNLLDIIGLEQELSEILGIKVDLVTERSLKKELKEYIFDDLKMIFNE